MKKLATLMRLMVSCALCWFSTQASSQTPVWTITPITSTSVTVPVNGFATINYTVTNQSNHPHSLTLLPIAGINQISGAANLCGDHFTLPNKGSSCILSLQVDGSQFHVGNKLVATPIVCQQPSNGQPNPQECYSTSTADNLKITIGPLLKQFAYVTNQGNKTVSICPVNYTATGATLGVCTTSTGNDADDNPTFDQTSFIAINSSGTIAYVTNSNQFSPDPDIGSVSICPINSDGSFGACTVSNDPTFINPVGIAINSSNTYAYVAINSFSPSVSFGVSICPINNDGSFGTCNYINMLPPFPTPAPQYLQGIRLNATETALYIPDASSNIYMCPLTAGGSSINGCSIAGGSDVCNPNGFSFNSDGSFAYITWGGCSMNLVSICAVNEDGTLGTAGACDNPAINSPTDGNGTFNFSGPSSSNAFTMGTQGFGFIPNNGTVSTVSICPTNPDGSLDTCIPSTGNDQSGNSTFNVASCVALYPQ